MKEIEIFGDTFSRQGKEVEGGNEVQKSSGTGDKERASQQTGPFSLFLFFSPHLSPIQKQTRLRSTLLIGRRRSGCLVRDRRKIEIARARERIEIVEPARAASHETRKRDERNVPSLIRRATVALYRMLANGKRIFQHVAGERRIYLPEKIQKTKYKCSQ